MNQAPDTDDADTTDEEPFTIHDCGVLSNEWPPLLLDLVGVWGSANRIDPLTAAPILLTILGGIAGNRVRIDAPVVGDLPPAIQLAIIRDESPLLKRAIQRALGAIEARIIETIRPYEHLSDRRAQNNELACLETRLNAAMQRLGALERIAGDDRQMVKEAVRQNDIQLLAELDAKKLEVAELKERSLALRFRIRPMIMVPEFGVPELDLLDRWHSTGPFWRW